MQSLFPLCAVHEEVALRSHIKVEVSPGNLDLTPLSVIYHFDVLLNINGVPPSAIVTESMLKGVIKGNFARDHKLTAWEQTYQGFLLEFRPELLDSHGTHNRRYFRGIKLYCEYVHPVTSDFDRLFASTVHLLDLAMTTAVNCLHQVVPALFTRFSAVQRVEPLVGALSRAIVVHQQQTWQHTEGQLLSNMRPQSREWNINDPQMVAPVNVKLEDIDVLDGIDATHTIISLQDLRNEIDRDEGIKQECEVKIECDQGQELIKSEEP